MRLSPVVASVVALSMFLSVICLVPDRGSAQPIAALVPPCNEFVEDTDLDGLIDYLVFEVTVEVYEPGWFFMVGISLSDSEGTVIRTSGTSGPVDVGTQVFPIAIEGIWIWGNGVDGPYTVTVSLHSYPWELVDEFIQVTDPYTRDQFEILPAMYGDAPSASGADIDLNGRYEFLVAEADVYVQEAKEYTLKYIVDGFEGTDLVTINVTEETLYLEQGVWPKSFSIRGSIINAVELDGPYWVFLQIYDEVDGHPRGLDQVSCYTPAYSYTDFEAGSTTSTFSSSPPTIDGVFESSEWDDATIVDLGRPDMENPFGAAMLVTNNLTHLQVCIDVVADLTEDMGDCAAVSFDTDNDNITIDGREDQFLVGPSFVGQTVHLVYSAADTDWVIHCGPFDPTMPSHDGLAAASGFGSSPSLVDDHRIYEFSIPLELIGAEPVSVIGFAVSSDLVHGVFDESLNDGSSWPYFMEPGAPLMNFGDLTIGWPPIETAAFLSGTIGSAGWYVSPVNVTLSATGGALGIDRTMYKLDGAWWSEYVSPFECGEDGDHSLDYRSYDVVGNSELVQSVDFKIDATSPTASASVSDWNVTLTAADSTSGVQKIMYRLDGGPWLNYTGTIQLTNDANHTVEYYPVDFAGNTGETRTLTVEKKEVEEEQGGGGAGFLGWDFMIVLLIIALIVIISVPKLFGMRRKAKESDARAAVKDIGTAMSQYVDDTTVKKEEPPKPPESGR